jgi:hypothetical protein
MGRASGWVGRGAPEIRQNFLYLGAEAMRLKTSSTAVWLLAIGTGPSMARACAARARCARLAASIETSARHLTVRSSVTVR